MRSRLFRLFAHGGVRVADLDVRCQRLQVGQKHAPVGLLRPRAVFLLLIARMAAVASPQLS